MGLLIRECQARQVWRLSGLILITKRRRTILSCRPQSEQARKSLRHLRGPSLRIQHSRRQLRVPHRHRRRSLWVLHKIARLSISLLILKNSLPIPATQWDSSKRLAQVQQLVWRALPPRRKQLESLTLILGTKTMKKTSSSQWRMQDRSHKNRSSQISMIC